MKLRCLNKLSNATIKAPLNFEFGGVTFKFTALIKVVDQDDLDELLNPASSTDVQTVRALLTGWEEFIDEGETVEFNAETLEEMLKYGGIAGRLSVECINAQYRVQEKN